MRTAWELEATCTATQMSLASVLNEWEISSLLQMQRWRRGWEGVLGGWVWRREAAGIGLDLPTLLPGHHLSVQGLLHSAVLRRSPASLTLRAKPSVSNAVKGHGARQVWRVHLSCVYYSVMKCTKRSKHWINKLQCNCKNIGIPICG